MSRTVIKKRRPKTDPKKESNAIDAFLLQRDLERKPVAKDGSCLFRAVAEQAWLTQARHEELRVLCAYHIRKYTEYFKSFLTVPVDQYSFHLVGSKLWGGEIELVALAQLLEIKILVYSYNEEKKGKVEQMEFKGANVKKSEPVRLAYFDKNHYDSVWSLKEKKTTAMCQSIVYEVLMEKVLKEKLSKASRQHLNTITEEKLTSLSIPSDTLQLTHRFTDEVVQALAPFVYRNTPLHVEWRERQSREQTDRHVAAQMQFQVGQSCLVHVSGGKVYHGQIKGVDTGKTDSDSKNAQVYIQEKSAIWSVSYKNIVLNHSPYNTRKKEEFQRPATKRGTPKYQQQQKDKHHSSAVDTTSHPTKPSSHYATVSTSSTAAVETGKGGSAVQNSRDASLAKGLLGECPKEFEPQQLMQQVQTHKQQRQWLAEKQPHVQQSHQQSNQRPQSSAAPQTFKAAVIGGSNNSSSARGPSRNTNGPLNSSLVVKPALSSTLKETPLQSSNLTPGTSLPASVTNRGDTTSNKRLQQELVASKKNTSSMPWTNKSKPYSAVSNGGGVAHSDGGSTPSSSSDECATSPHNKMAPLHMPVHYQSVGYHTDPAGQPSRSQQHVSQRVLPQDGTSLSSGDQNQLPETRSSITKAATYDPTDPSVELPATSHTSSMVVPPLLHPHQPHSSLDETSRFLNSTAYMNSLIGRPYPEILTQKQLSAITDAPESEWPNLTAEDLKAAAYAQSGTCSFIDGPPAGTAANENVNSQVMGFQMPMLFPQGHQFMYILMNEMNPPLHLLECNTNEARRQFMFEYAQKCLRVYTKYMNDSELEDKLNDLLCMDLEEFSASISESQLSVGTSCTSRAESEVTDDYNGFTSVVSSCPTDSHVPLYKREEEQSNPEIGGGVRTAEDEDKVSDNVHPRKLNTEEENYLSSLQQISGSNFMPTSAELTMLEGTVPSPVGMSTAEEDSPLSDTVASSNDVSHATLPPPNSYPESVPEEKINDDQEEEDDKPSLHPPMGPSMYPHMMGPHPLMVPRLPPPYFMPYYYPPYGFPPGPWPGYIHPMMFPPMPVVPVPSSPQQPQEDKNVVDSNSDNEQSKPTEVHISEGSPSNTLVTNDDDLVNEKEGLSTGGSSTELQDGMSKFQPSTSLLPNSQSSDVSVHQPSPSPQQSSSQELLPQHQIPQQNDHTKGPSSLHIPPKDNTASTHKTSYRHYKKSRSTGAPSKKEHPVESERSAMENKATIVVKENPKRERDADKTTKGNSSADSIPEPIPRALPISSQDNLEKLGSKNDEKATESSNQQTTSRQTHRYNNQHGQYGGRQQHQSSHGYYRPFRRHNYSNRARGSYADNRTRTDASSHQEEGSSTTTSASSQDGSRYQGKRQEKQQSNDRVPRDGGPKTTVHESRPQGGGFRKSQKHTQQSTSGKFSKDATVRGIETYQPSHSPSVCLPFSSTYPWPDISSPGSSLKSPTTLTSFVTCTEESASVSMPSGLEPVLFGDPKVESHRKHCV